MSVLAGKIVGYKNVLFNSWDWEQQISPIHYLYPHPQPTGMSRAFSSGQEERAEARVKRAWAGDLVLSFPEALASRK